MPSLHQGVTIVSFTCRLIAYEISLKSYLKFVIPTRMVSFYTESYEGLGHGIGSLLA